MGWRSKKCSVKVGEGMQKRMENRRITVYKCDDGDIVVQTKSLNEENKIFRTNTLWTREGAWSLLELLMWALDEGDSDGRRDETETP